jgi:hypothetical protein
MLKRREDEISQSPKNPNEVQMCCSPVSCRMLNKSKHQEHPLKMRRAATVTGSGLTDHHVVGTINPNFEEQKPLLESTLESKDMIRRISIDTVNIY